MNTVYRQMINAIKMSQYSGRHLVLESCITSSNLSDVRPRSVPALELHSRAESSVGVMYRFRGPNTGSNPGERQILKKNLVQHLAHYYKRICDWTQ